MEAGDLVVYVRVVASIKAVFAFLQDDPPGAALALMHVSGVFESIDTVSKTPLMVRRAASAGLAIIPACVWHDQK